jgi:hypothetical protein
VDQEALVTDRILGLRAVEAFDQHQDKLKAKAVFWLFRSESGVWRLVVATPLVDNEGPRKAYDTIARILDKAKLPDDRKLSEELSIIRISALGLRDPLVKAFRKAFHTKRNDISWIHVFDSVLDGMHVDDAYIYRMN